MRLPKVILKILAMRAVMALAILAGVAGSTAMAAAPETSRQRQNFNAGWRFHLGDISGAETPDFDDRNWQAIGLPHSFSIPYFQSPEAYVGYGWYRKDLVLPAGPSKRRWMLEFEGAFQTAEVYVNGLRIARHRGGYTGFPVDMTRALHPGRNVVAVRVDNVWDPTLAPRAGEHIFSGGIYRDMWLVSTDDVHVPWTGTTITTPHLEGRSGAVRVATEVRNDGLRPVKVRVKTRITNRDGATIAVLPDAAVQVAPGQTIEVSQESARLQQLNLWSPETPTLYNAITTLNVGGRQRDCFETEFGFRTIEWTADKGFFLNGQHRYFRGANVHQDQAGWGDAVTNTAIDRDVQWMKDAGLDFIRGSHYPHDPHFAEATDRIGMMYLSEVPFWGTAGFHSPWGAPAYPSDPKLQAAFDDSVKQQLTEMIRIHRNHPSIIAWGMDNEVFFTAEDSMPGVRNLLTEEVALSHHLDPTRPAAVDGAQRGDIDHIGDIAGYNGDGAILFPNPGIPSFVAEYGSTIADRPGEYDPGWGDIEHTPGATAGQPSTWHLSWRSGEAIWAGFDHGTIAGRRFGSMGLVDYARLPKRSWYWYRNAYRGIAPPAWPQPGKPAALRVTASSPVIRHADGTDDVQLVVTVVDADGHPLSNSPPVRLTLEAGPGELPTGRSIAFTPDGDIPIHDGQAAIAMRSWHRGVTHIRATSLGIADGVLTVETVDGPQFMEGVTPVTADRPYEARKMAEGPEQEFGLKNPTFASSSTPGHASSLVNDGNVDSWWAPAANDRQPWIIVDPERILNYHRVSIRFAPGARCDIKAEAQDVGGVWRPLADATATADRLAFAVQAVTARRLRLSLDVPIGGTCNIAEIGITGTPDTR